MHGQQGVDGYNGCCYSKITKLTSSKVSRMAFGFPGKLMIKDFPLKPAVCLDRTAVGTYLHNIALHSKF